MIQSKRSYQSQITAKLDLIFSLGVIYQKRLLFLYLSSFLFIIKVWCLAWRSVHHQLFWPCKVRPILCACELRPIKVPPPNYQIYDNYCKEVFCTPESSLGVAIICALNRWQPSGGRFDVSKQTFNLYSQKQTESQQMHWSLIARA